MDAEPWDYASSRCLHTANVVTAIHWWTDPPRLEIERAVVKLTENARCVEETLGQQPLMVDNAPFA